MSATMMNHSRRQILTPSGPSSSNKKKEINGVDVSKPSAAITTKNLAKPSIHRAPVPVPARLPQPASKNHLLAGYLAQEFLTKGTLFGEPWDPARAEAVPLSTTYGSRRGEKRKAESGEGAGKIFEKQQRYLEVADLVKGDGTHLPGIVNPTHLARFLQLS